MTHGGTGLTDEETTFLFVRSYAPDAYRSAAELEAALGNDLESFVGEKLDDIWLVWDVEGNEWFCDAPVILGVAGKQIEVSAHKLDELYVSIDGIDRRLPLGWPDDNILQLEWRRNPSIVPEALLGRTILGFGAAELAFDLADFVGTSPWVLVSFECALDGGHLAIENGLDENALRFERATREDFRVSWFSPG